MPELPTYCCDSVTFSCVHLFSCLLLQRANPIRADHCDILLPAHTPIHVHRGFSGSMTIKRQGHPLRRSRSAEVLMLTHKNDNPDLSTAQESDGAFMENVRDNTNQSERVRSLTPTPDMVDTGGIGVSNSKHDSQSGNLLTPASQPIPRGRAQSESVPPSQPPQGRRKLSLQEVSAAVVPFLPAATMVIHVGVFAVIKTLSS